MENIHTSICPGCGKSFPTYINGHHEERKFCSKECWQDFGRKRTEAKQRAAKARTERKREQQKTLVPQELCKNCKYSMKYMDLFHCGYVLKMDTTRTKLHPEGLTADCLEFEPKRRRKQCETS